VRRNVPFVKWTSAFALAVDNQYAGFSRLDGGPHFRGSLSLSLSFSLPLFVSCPPSMQALTGFPSAVLLL